MSIFKWISWYADKSEMAQRMGNQLALSLIWFGATCQIILALAAEKESVVSNAGQTFVCGKVLNHHAMQIHCWSHLVYLLHDNSRKKKKDSWKCFILDSLNKIADIITCNPLTI